MPTLVYKYTGKPKKPQNLLTSYTAITDGRFKAPGDGYMWSMLYLNVEPEYARGKTHAGLRTRMVREAPFDDTAYQDWAVNKDMVASTFLLSTTWFGAADRDRWYHWEGRRAKSLSSAYAGTRYSKWLWISKELAGSVLLGAEAQALINAFHTDEGDAPVELVL